VDQDHNEAVKNTVGASQQQQQQQKNNGQREREIKGDK